MFDCDTRSYLAGVEALHDDAVLVELVLGLHPLRLALFSGQGMDYGLTFLRVKESLYWRKKRGEMFVAKRIRGNLLENVLSFANGEIWRRSCKVWRKFSLVFSCWQTHCLRQPESISYFDLFQKASFLRGLKHGIIRLAVS